MKIKAVLFALTLAATTCLLPAQESKPGPEGERPLPPPPGGPGFHVLPRGAREKLNLNAEQQKQLADLETEVKAKIEKILTPEQLEQDVTVYVSGVDEFYGLVQDYPIAVAQSENTDVLDPGHTYLVI